MATVHSPGGPHAADLQHLGEAELARHVVVVDVQRVKGEQREVEVLAVGRGVQRAALLRQVELQLRLGSRGGNEEAQPAGMGEESTGTQTNWRWEHTGAHGCTAGARVFERGGWGRVEGAVARGDCLSVPGMLTGLAHVRRISGTAACPCTEHERLSPVVTACIQTWVAVPPVRAQGCWHGHQHSHTICRHSPLLVRITLGLSGLLQRIVRHSNVHPAVLPEAKGLCNQDDRPIIVLHAGEGVPRGHEGGRQQREPQQQQGRGAHRGGCLSARKYQAKLQQRAGAVGCTGQAVVKPAGLAQQGCRGVALFKKTTQTPISLPRRWCWPLTTPAGLLAHNGAIERAQQGGTLQFELALDDSGLCEEFGALCHAGGSIQFEQAQAAGCNRLANAWSDATGTPP